MLTERLAVLDPENDGLSDCEAETLSEAEGELEVDAVDVASTEVDSDGENVVAIDAVALAEDDATTEGEALDVDDAAEGAALTLRQFPGQVIVLFSAGRPE